MAGPYSELALRRSPLLPHAGRSHRRIEDYGTVGASGKTLQRAEGKKSDLQRSKTDLKKASTTFLSQPDVVCAIGVCYVVRLSPPSRYSIKRCPKYIFSKALYQHRLAGDFEVGRLGGEKEHRS